MTNQNGLNQNVCISVKRKNRIVAEVRTVMETWRSECKPDLALDSACLYWGVLTVVGLRRHGIEAVIVGGSMSWPRIDLSTDDGKVLTHFSYQWEPTNIVSAIALATGHLPECHAWAYIPSTEEIVEAGMAWTNALPPDYLWCHHAKLPQGVYYTPVREATEMLNVFALDVAAQIMGRRPI